MKKSKHHLIIAGLLIFFLALCPENGLASKKKSSKATSKHKSKSHVSQHVSQPAKKNHKSQQVSQSTKKIDKSPVSQLLKKIENRYDSVSFSADFFQESPLPEIQVTETAQGKAYFKKTGKFRWEYEKPEVLHYISNGVTLWIHSPSDNNVWTGKSKEFFGKGSGANVLTDVKQIRNQFVVSIADSSDENTTRLKLVPKIKSMGFTDIFLTVDKSTYDILKIVSFNMNGEETRIEFKNLEFKPFSDDVMFNFKIPAKANVIPLEQKM